MFEFKNKPTAKQIANEICQLENIIKELNQLSGKLSMSRKDRVVLLNYLNEIEKAEKQIQKLKSL